ncbi:MFS transporter [Sphingomonas sp.]|uniref:MFS transporter n=1 Tax=Sphingomonas sp. TaxID=28214 RepID=UPI0031D76A7F
MTRATAALLIFGAAVVVAAEFVVIGLLPAMSADLKLEPAQAGWLVTVFALASALLGPPLVAVTARLPTAPVLAAALLPFAGNLLLLAAPTFALAIGLRILQGATLPLFMSLAGAQLGAARGTGPGIALLYIGVTIGGTLAPPTGSFVADRLGWQVPIAAIGALASIGALGCLLQGKRSRTDRAGSPWRLLARPAMRVHLLLSALTFAAMFAGFSYIALLLGQAGLGRDWTAAALLAFGLAGLAGNWLAGRLAIHALPATAGAALATAAMTLWIAASPGAPALVLAVLGWGVAHAAGFVFCQVRVMDAAPHASGFAGSLNIAAANVGIALGSFAGGRAIELAGAGGAAGTAMAFALLTAVVAATCRLRNVILPSSFRNRTETGIAPD